MEGQTKTLEQKTIIERHTNSEGKFNLAIALVESDNKVKELTKRIEACEEALTFFSEWYNKTQRANIILPDNLDESGQVKLIL